MLRGGDILVAHRWASLGGMGKPSASCGPEEIRGLPVHVSGDRARAGVRAWGIEHGLENEGTSDSPSARHCGRLGFSSYRQGVKPSQVAKVLLSLFIAVAVTACGLNPQEQARLAAAESKAAAAEAAASAAKARADKAEAEVAGLKTKLADQTSQLERLRLETELCKARPIPK